MTQPLLENSGGLPLRRVLVRMQHAIMKQTSYFGVQAYRNPLDAWLYQEIIHEHRPDAIIEIGNRFGGGTLYLAHLCDLLGHGRVIGVDIRHADVAEVVRQHPRVTLLEGDAVARLDDVRALIQGCERLLVIEDSSHTYDNTLAVLRAYGELLRPGDHFIVEDTICHHGLDVGPSPGPYEAVETFLREDARFAVHRDRERFLVTWNPMGYLTRIA